MNDRPSLAELRDRVFKHSGTNRPEQGNWLARRVGRPSAIYGTWVVSRTKLPAHAVTLAALIANTLGAVGIGSGTRLGFVGGVFGLMVGYWLDHVDGQVARWRGTSSLTGVYFDYLLHHATALMLGFALGFGLTARGESVLWSLLGFAIAVGWTGLNLHNDCMYKAMFTQLKRERRVLRVNLGDQERWSSPSSWPKNGPGVFTWPMAKLCEPHVVLMGLCGLMVAAVLWPVLWFIVWKLGVVLMAMIAPVIAIGRVSKSILRREPDREFDRVFRPN